MEELPVHVDHDHPSCPQCGWELDLSSPSREILGRLALQGGVDMPGKQSVESDKSMRIIEIGSTHTTEIGKSIKTLGGAEGRYKAARSKTGLKSVKDVYKATEQQREAIRNSL